MPTDPRETFSRSADRYLKSTDHRAGPDLETIRDAARRILPRVTLDVATGAGHALRVAAPFSAFCLAQDLTLEMLKVTREHLASVGIEGVSCIQSRADGIPVGDGCVDLVLCRIACHHFPSVPAFLGEVRRILSPEGILLLIDSLAPSDVDGDRFINTVERIRDPSHVRSLDREQWRDHIKGSGLRVKEEKKFERRHPFDEWVERVGLKGAGLRALEREFVEAPEHIKDQFHIEISETGQVLSYTDEKIIFVAGR
ncbi:MAG: class I SAM-dependent methyltransferase [bacterium]|nr:MAG: class I SAM-dependent methyltransferase [bacterium]